MKYVFFVTVHLQFLVKFIVFEDAMTSMMTRKGQNREVSLNDIYLYCCADH